MFSWTRPATASSSRRAERARNRTNNSVQVPFDQIECNEEEDVSLPPSESLNSGDQDKDVVVVDDLNISNEVIVGSVGDNCPQVLTSPTILGISKVNLSVLKMMTHPKCLY